MEGAVQGLLMTGVGCLASAVVGYLGRYAPRNPSASLGERYWYAMVRLHTPLAPVMGVVGGLCVAASAVIALAR